MKKANRKLSNKAWPKLCWRDRLFIIRARSQFIDPRVKNVANYYGGRDDIRRFVKQGFPDDEMAAIQEANECHLYYKVPATYGRPIQLWVRFVGWVKGLFDRRPRPF